VEGKKVTSGKKRGRDGGRGRSFLPTSKGWNSLSDEKREWALGAKVKKGLLTFWGGGGGGGLGKKGIGENQ